MKPARKTYRMRTYAQGHSKETSLYATGHYTVCLGRHISCQVDMQNRTSGKPPDLLCQFVSAEAMCLQWNASISFLADFQFSDR